MIGLPTIFFTKRNRSAYKFLGTCTTHIDGEHIIWKHPDIGFIDELILEKCYIPNADFEIKNDYTVIDAGSNVGVFTLYAAHKAKNGKVFAIETDKYEYKRLVENVEINKFKNIVTINAALANHTDGVFFSNSQVYSEKIEGKHKKNYIYEGKCDSVTIPSLIKKYLINKIDFLKLDIEGSEFDVFVDAEWLDIVKIISMELHAEETEPKALKIKNTLEKYQFDVKILKNGGTIYCYAHKK